jgi:hypothetical protein
MNGHRKQIRTSRAIGYIFMSAGLALTGVGCKESQERVLRMEVELGDVKAQPIALPNGSTVNFPSVATDLFYRQVMNHSHFNIYSPIASQTAAATSSARTSAKAASAKTVPAAVAGLGQDDLELLTKYGMLSRLATPPAPVKTGLSAKSVSAMTTVDASIPQCVYERPLAKLGSKVVSFEANFGAGLKLGYDAAGGIALGQPVGASMDFKSAKMDLTVHWDDNFTRQGIAAAEGVSYSGDAKFSVGLGSMPLGMDFIYKTPLADVVKAAFTSGLDQAVIAYVAKTAGAGKTWSDAWEARVISDPLVDNDNFVAFRSGTYGGVMKGDKFTVRNQAFRWMDDSNPCNSALKYTLPDGDIIAELEVTESSNLITIAKVKALGDGSIRPGAQIKIQALVVPEPETAPQQ